MNFFIHYFFRFWRVKDFDDVIMKNAYVSRCSLDFWTSTRIHRSAAIHAPVRVEEALGEEALYPPKIAIFLALTPYVLVMFILCFFSFHLHTKMTLINNLNFVWFKIHYFTSSYGMTWIWRGWSCAVCSVEEEINETF